jgi:peptidoglycan-associated lipoprotein
MALGERRAEATRAYLISQGVAAGRLTIISYGEERPQCMRSDKECWAKNRRSHFLTKQQ